jgi:hypothetical protein
MAPGGDNRGQNDGSFTPCGRTSGSNALFLAWKTEYGVERVTDVPFMDTPLRPQLHKQDRLWQPGRVMGDAPDTQVCGAVPM